MNSFGRNETKKLWKVLSPVLIIALVLGGIFVPAKKVKAADVTCYLNITFDDGNGTSITGTPFEGKTIPLQSSCNTENLPDYISFGFDSLSVEDRNLLSKYYADEAHGLMIGFDCYDDRLEGNIQGHSVFSVETILEDPILIESGAYLDNEANFINNTVTITLVPDFDTAKLSLTLVDPDTIDASTQDKLVVKEYGKNIDRVEYFDSVPYGVFSVTFENDAPTATHQGERFAGRWTPTGDVGLNLVGEDGTPHGAQDMPLVFRNDNVNEVYVELSTLMTLDDYTLGAELNPVYEQIPNVVLNGSYSINLGQHGGNTQAPQNSEYHMLDTTENNGTRYITAEAELPFFEPEDGWEVTGYTVSGIPSGINLVKEFGNDGPVNWANGDMVNIESVNEPGIFRFSIAESSLEGLNLNLTFTAQYEEIIAPKLTIYFAGENPTFVMGSTFTATSVVPRDGYYRYQVEMYSSSDDYIRYWSNVLNNDHFTVQLGTTNATFNLINVTGEILGGSTITLEANITEDTTITWSSIYGKGLINSTGDYDLNYYEAYLAAGNWEVGGDGFDYHVDSGSTARIYGRTTSSIRFTKKP